jgi:hypothetical protein
MTEHNDRIAGLALVLSVHIDRLVGELSRIGTLVNQLGRELCAADEPDELPRHLPAATNNNAILETPRSTP